MRIVVAGFVSLAIAAVVATVLLRTTDDQSPEVPAGGAAVEVNQTEVSAEVVTPRAPAVQAAEAARAAIVSSGDLASAGFFSRQDLIRSFTTPGFAPEMIDQTTHALTDFQFTVNTTDGFWMIEQPITLSTELLAPDRARVVAWCVVVVASTEFGVGRESWETVTLDMALVDGRWLVDGWSVSPGPAPAPSADLMFADPSVLGEAMSRPRVGTAG